MKSCAMREDTRPDRTTFKTEEYEDAAIGASAASTPKQSKAELDAALDCALVETFPASDPISIIVG